VEITCIPHLPGIKPWAMRLRLNSSLRDEASTKGELGNEAVP